MKFKFLLTTAICAFIGFTSTLSAQWSPLGTGNDTINTNGADIDVICTDPSGNVYAAGQFLDAGGDRYVAKWNGTTWTELGTGTFALNASDDILSICSDPSGNIYAAGAFTNATTGQAYVAKWNGTTWTELGAGQGMGGRFPQKVTSICSDASGNIYAGGQITDSSFVNYIVTKFDGTHWAKVGNPTFNSTTDLVAVNGNNVYTTGQFTNGASPGAGHCYVAQYNGTSWTEVGAGSGALNMTTGNYGRALTTDASNNVYVGGSFLDAAGNQYVAKYNGSAWSELGGAASLGSNVQFNDIRALICDAAGNVYAGGDFFTSVTRLSYVAKWNGSSWSDYGHLDVNNSALTIATYSNIVYAAGVFSHDGNNDGSRYVAKYDGTAAGVNNVTISSLALYPNPTNGACTVAFGKSVNATITLTDLTGKMLEVWQSKNEATVQCNLTQYATGIYMIKVETESGETHIAKVIKQ